jgi:hypothetical protein
VPAAWFQFHAGVAGGLEWSWQVGQWHPDAEPSINVAIQGGMGADIEVGAGWSQTF